MAGRYDKPDANYIRKFASARTNEFQNQRKEIDDRAWAVYSNTHKLQVSNPKPGVKVTRRGSGVGFSAVQQDVGVLSTNPFIRFNPLKKDSDSRDKADLREAHMNGIFRQSQINPVWKPMVRDLVLFGRGMGPFYHMPHLWTGDEIDEAIEAWLATDDLAVMRDAERTIEAFKADNFPHRWRYADPRTTWPLRSLEHKNPEVIETRMMTLEQIRADFGDDAVPGPLEKEPSDTKVSVLIHTNWNFETTLVPDEEDPRIVKMFEHGMGRSPYVWMEGPLFPENNKGWVWIPSLFPVFDTIEAYDEILSNLTHAIDMETHSGVLFKVDAEARGLVDPKIGGDDHAVVRKPDKDTTLLKGEEAGPMPVSHVNPEHYPLLQIHQAQIEQTIVTPSFRGANSQEANVTFNTEVELSERLHEPRVEAQQEAALEFGQIAIAAGAALAKSSGFEDIDDKVYIIHALQGQVALGPKDYRGWKNTMQVRIKKVLPTNENAQVAVAAAHIDMGLPREHVWETKLDKENAHQLSLDRLVEDMVVNLMQLAQQELLTRAGGAFQQASSASLAQVTNLVGNAPQALRDAATGMGMQLPPGGAAMSGIRSNTNAAGAGVPLSPQVPNV